MIPRRHLHLLTPVALAVGLFLVGDAGAMPAAPRASALPSVSISSHPANPTSATLASFGLMASSGATTCSLDGAAYAPCGTQVTFTALRAGTHTFSARATSGPNNKVSSYSWTVDTTAPSAPTGLAAAVQSQSVSLAWRASADPDSPLAYAVYRNGAKIAQTSTTAYTDSTVGRGAAYQYAVAAYDPAGNTSATSAPATVTTAGTPPPLGVPGTWTLKFDDEFSGTSLNTSTWQPNWLAGNNTAITPPPNSADLNCTDPAQVSESAGVLHLSAAAQSCRASNGRTYSYAAGLVNTHNSYTYTYGYAEARIYIPASASGAPANFPAFWADGTGTWPTTGELDVMEVLGDCGPGIGYHFHSSAGAFGGCASMPVTTGWHTFGANWQSGVVTYYYDGVQVGRIAQGVTASPMYLILNNGIDTTYGGPTTVPSDLQVDYVRVWQ